ncbi:TfuA-like protein [Streptomyces sp. NPDC002004]
MAAGEVLGWGLGPGDELLVIDGVFPHTRSVRFEELLALLDRGVRVLGAAALGALRAAELEPFGMRGVGRVFADYRDGVLVGDDEVALAHADADLGHRPLTWALVDLRHSVRVAVERGVLDRHTATAVVRAAKGMPFAARRTSTVLATAGRHGADAAKLSAFAEFCRKEPRSIRRLDAVAALRLMAAGPRPRTEDVGRRDTATRTPTAASA